MRNTITNSTFGAVNLVNHGGEDKTTKHNEKAHRGQMTKLLKAANELFNDVNLSQAQPQPAQTPAEQAAVNSVVKIQGIMDSIHTKLDVLKHLDEEVNNLIPEEELEA